MRSRSRVADVGDHAVEMVSMSLSARASAVVNITSKAPLRTMTWLRRFSTKSRSVPGSTSSDELLCLRTHSFLNLIGGEASNCSSLAFLTLETQPVSGASNAQAGCLFRGLR